ncbi:hypothetical protein K438DRAFT_1470477, partial [Mycena galopus ATCC 62051]
RVAILGAGGMGKTTLARAVLHDPDTSSQFQHRFFVSAEAATTSIELAALIGSHIGLNPGKNLTKAVVQYFSRKSSYLLILDNLETVWEPLESRAATEKFLGLLTALEGLGLIITMRGAERPAGVQWTHPFLSPLNPLSNNAAMQTFMDITDATYSADEVSQLLPFTGNLPLAVDLMAHLKTSLLSGSNDRRSSVDASISLSLSSPRLTSESKELLSLLSILPNGLSAAELVQAHLGIPNILRCKATLQATSLAYQDINKRILFLVPVREYIQRFMPPPQSRVKAIRQHFYYLLELYETYVGE